MHIELQLPRDERELVTFRSAVGKVTGQLQPGTINEHYPARGALGRPQHIVWITVPRGGDAKAALSELTAVTHPSMALLPGLCFVNRSGSGFGAVFASAAGPAACLARPVVPLLSGGADLGGSRMLPTARRWTAVRRCLFPK